MRRPAIVVLALGFWAAAACKRLDDATADLGGPCVDDGECTSRCLTEPRWPQGFCTRDCATTADCPVAAECVTRELEGAVCLFACLDDRDCDFLESSLLDDAWRCARDGERKVKVCVPRAEDAAASSAPPRATR